MLKVARSLINADRTGSWSMHLCAVLSCLPVFAAAGHYNYLKSAYFLYPADEPVTHKPPRSISKI
jgi:hypothetical protein